MIRERGQKRIDENRGRHLLSTADQSNSGRGERQEASEIILFNTEALRNAPKVTDSEAGDPLVVYRRTMASNFWRSSTSTWV